MKPIFVAVDFDGTCVAGAFPDVGHEIGAPVWLRDAQALAPDRVKLILLTMRSPAYHLGLAQDWFAYHEIPLYATNENPLWEENPKTIEGSRKVYAHLYVDDLSLGIPTAPDPFRAGHHIVDWRLAGPMLLTAVSQRLEW